MAYQPILSILEDTGAMLQKTQINLRKCPKVRLTKGYIQIRLTTIDEYWNTYKNAHQELIKCVPREKRSELSYFANEEFYLFEDLYLNLQADLRDILDKLILPSPSLEATNQSTASTSGDALIKLPRIQIPVFSGVYEEWPAFQDMYETLIHNNAALSNVQRLHYLKTSLSGEAESLLKHVQVTGDNYEPSWTMLKSRYGNKRIIVNSLLKRLFMQKKIINQSANQIKSLLDTTTECINSLKNMKIRTDSWDPLIIFLVVQKLDPETHRDWEEFAYKEDTEDLPTWEDLSKFLQSKFRTIELISTSKEKTVRPREYTAMHVATFPTKPRICSICNDDHTLSHCKEFTKMTPEERSEYVKNTNLCFNCLAPGHSVSRCRLNMSCRLCHRRHHTLVHQSSRMTPPNQPDNLQGNHAQLEDHEHEKEDFTEPTLEIASHYASNTTSALLATALVTVKDENGHTTVLRALIDHGSQATFITERAAQTLKLKRTPIKATITGVGATKTNVKHSSEVLLSSEYDPSFICTTKAYIMPTRLTSELPSKSIKVNNWSHLQGLTLADPGFHCSARVDMLLGVEVCALIMKDEVIKGPPGTPSAQNTSLGWIVFGTIQANRKNEEISVMHHKLELDDLLKRMWECEENEQRKYTAQEVTCEELYQSTTTRTEEGRYVVKLPQSCEKLLSIEGNSREIAFMRLKQLERRFEKNLSLKHEYAKIMQEYIDLNHMQEVPTEEINNPAVYLPHHAVVKTEKETTKIRIVFNASQKGKNDVSLNDELLVGPQLQEDIRSLIMRWRMKRVCYVADVKMMYRQILVTKDDQNLQRVLWRNNPNDEIKHYKLLRLTFGTASAPYLAVKTLHQIAVDEGQHNPEAARIIKEDFFMDDLMSGDDTPQSAIKNAKDVQSILKRGGFVLQKWCSNSAQFLNQFSAEERSIHVDLNITLDGMIRALGLHWNMGKDQFQYSFKLPEPKEPITKRVILADVQRLFDPLGWLAPAVIQTKLFIQSLWLQGITWDETVSETTAEQWASLRDSFKILPEMKLERWMYVTEANMKDATIHGFCDASTKAYAAVAYLRVPCETGEIKTSLIAARTRVAPIKPMSLPRLELSGAVLLSRLLKQIKEALRMPSSQIYAWTDSTIVLSWLFGDPARWNTFVRNRVVEVLDNIGNHNWFHVQSGDNPADVASRGKPLKELKNEKIWWSGPEWLKQNEIQYNRHQSLVTELERREMINVNLKIATDDKFSTKFNNFDNLTELIKSVTYCRRFLKQKYLKNDEAKITTTEMEESLQRCVAIAQKEDFYEDIRYLKEKKIIRKDSRIKTLQPYLDKNNVLRVGGRLRHSDLPEDGKHPMILDFENPLTDLIVTEAHIKTMHGGCQLMLAYLRNRFWVLKAKNAVKKNIRKCLICARLSATAKSQLMGDLPKERVTPTRAFLNSGVDFAGPYQILMSKGRGAKTTKAYISLFICMSTKAIHLELVGDLTSESFIGAFKRFVSRRGRCNHIWSDQGTNFVGANKELATAWADAKFKLETDVVETLALDGTQWHFIPAYSPHMGGLWEAGVKSVKHHLKRVLTTNLTFEEMSTLLCQIEACLNSRPLSPIEDTDTHHIQPLTPGHFLIGEAPIIVPSPDLKDIKMHHLSRWQHMQKLLNDFWHRWQNEYLSRLQQRPKWLKKIPEFDIGHIVLVKSDNLPPGKWMLGRIIDKHPGADGVTRVYSVKSGDNITKRCANKLCYLPINTET